MTSFQLSTAPYARTRTYEALLPGNQSAKDGKMVNLDQCGAELGGWLSVPARQGRKKEIAVVCRKYGWLVGGVVRYSHYLLQENLSYKRFGPR